MLRFVVRCDDAITDLEVTKTHEITKLNGTESFFIS